jgi:hypothetical protein
MAPRTYKRHWGLTVEQQNAIDLLVEGHPDRVVAEEVGVQRATVTCWRLYDPAFQAALNRRRDELWRDSVDGVRSLLPSALETLVDQLAVGEQRGRLALDFLRSAGVFGRPTAGGLGAHLVGPTDPDEILDAEVHRRMRSAAGPSADPNDLPISDADREAVLADLASIAALESR